MDKAHATTRVNHDEWERWKNTIQILYDNGKGMGLKKLQQTMAKEHAFNATSVHTPILRLRLLRPANTSLSESQYRRQLFKTWAFNPPNLPKDRAANEWLRTSRTIKERARRGKLSQVTMYGEPVDESRVKKATNRYDYDLLGPRRRKYLLPRTA